MQAGTGDVLSGVAGGTNTLMTGGANNALNSGGNSVSDLSNSSGDLVSRAPEPGVGVSQPQLPNTILLTPAKLACDLQAGVGDLLSGAAGGTNSLIAGGANNLLNNGGNSVADVSSLAGDLVD